MQELNSKGERFRRQLVQRDRQSRHHDEPGQVGENTIHVAGAGGAVTAVYEQLRNAAENAEEHLLLQNAIRRFFRQLFINRDQALIAESGNELIVELTLAGYIPNDSVTKQTALEISHIAKRYYAAYEALLERRDVAPDSATHWTLDVLAVAVERTFRRDSGTEAFIDFCFSVLRPVTDASRPNADAALYVAVQQALLRADHASVRASLLDRYKADIDRLDEYVAYNRQFDELIDSEQTDALFHVVDRRGAPLRILRRMLDDEPNITELMTRKNAFLERYEQTVRMEYSRVAERINLAIIRAVVFLIITKVLIGIAIEVPYDMWAHGEIIWLPLIINLLFPPIYMFALKMTQRLPGEANTRALVAQIDDMLYGDGEALMSKRQRKSFGAIFSILYVVISLLVIAAVLYGLLLLKFSLVHIIIFFIFVSAASFLGFRLSRNIRELEVVQTSQNGMTLVRDVLYLPFVVVGQWMSDKYSKVNIVTIILDMLIELPLKTILRLVRQWSAFLDDRKDRI